MIGAELFCDCFLTGVEAFLIKIGIEVLFLGCCRALMAKQTKGKHSSLRAAII
ncbi:hypothetical protein IYQ_13658 [Aeromonas salmonicida subsp. salmonicida 01-B526]|uniref:Uncharacterized protein n=1 Tax=Aeromonas salmonicida subsp. salmonicida 01-B526 TaxID=1076135 RepID=A0ABP2MZF1_AERSS|nr:hypothetical protein IYQ_13658 [Aeromonas salmonicida subsp. salmonicida 01-B526]